MFRKKSSNNCSTNKAVLLEQDKSGTSSDNKQSLNEVEQDMRNYKDRGLCYLPKAEADNTNRDLNNSSYPARTEFNNCFIIF